MLFNTPLPRRPVLGSTMAYREAGEASAPCALFLHGNPTSSYIWRDIIPHVTRVAHCIAPDLIGFGESGKPAIAYRFADHARYVDAFVYEAGITSAYIIAQDWGAALAFHLAARRPAFVRGLAFMEFIRPVATWEEFHQSPAGREMFQQFRTPGLGERLILDENAFIERGIPRSVVRKLADDEMAAYRAPFPTPESRRPIWQLPNEIPIGGTPADVNVMLQRAFDALRSSRFPKLFFVATPGSTVSPAFADAFAASLQDCKVVQLGEGTHNLQEDHPDHIGKTVAQWIQDCEA